VAERLRIRQQKARLLLQIYEALLWTKLETLSAKSDTAEAINYSLNQWGALTLYCEDGTLGINNDIAENMLRCGTSSRSFCPYRARN
jgi:transposase